MQIPEYFKFFNKTRIISGKKALENIPYELKSMDAVKPLVVTDRKSVKDGAVKTFINAYGDSGLVIGGVFDGVTEYASTSTVLDATELFKVRGCDSIIVIGGETAASVARGVNLLVSHKTGELVQLKDLPDTMHLLPFVVIPTSDSTGRETASGCCIDSTLFKSDELMPDIAVIDPRMLKKRDKSHTILTALSAMAGAIEACSEKDANPLNDSFAFASIQLIRENLQNAMKAAGSSKARLGLANGIAMAGIVSSNAPEGICSAVAEEIARVTGHSRLLCSSIVLPYMLNYKLKNVSGGVRGELLLPLAGIDAYCAAEEPERGALGVDAITALYSSLKKYIPVSFSELNIPIYILKNAVTEVEKKNPEQFNVKDCMNIIEAAYKGSLLSAGVRGALKKNDDNADEYFGMIGEDDLEAGGAN